MGPETCLAGRAWEAEARLAAGPLGADFLSAFQGSECNQRSSSTGEEEVAAALFFGKVPD